MNSNRSALESLALFYHNSIQVIMARAARLRPYTNQINGGEFAKKVPVQTTKTIAAIHLEAGDMATGVTEPVYSSVARAGQARCPGPLQPRAPR